MLLFYDDLTAVKSEPSVQMCCSWKELIGSCCLQDGVNWPWPNTEYNCWNVVLSGILVEFTFPDSYWIHKCPQYPKNNFWFCPNPAGGPQGSCHRSGCLTLIWPWLLHSLVVLFQVICVHVSQRGLSVSGLLKVYRVLMFVCAGSRGSLCVVCIISSTESGCLCWIPGSIKLSESDLMMTENRRWVTVRMGPSYTNTAQPVSLGRPPFSFYIIEIKPFKKGPISKLLPLTL